MIHSVLIGNFLSNECYSTFQGMLNEGKNTRAQGPSTRIVKYDKCSQSVHILPN